MRRSPIFKTARQRGRPHGIRGMDAPAAPLSTTTLPADVRPTAQFAGWEVDLPSRHVWWSEPMFATFDLSPGPSPGVDEALAFCAPEYRARARELFEACAREGRPYDEELEAVTATGRRIRLRTIGSAMRGPDGVIHRVQGAVQEIKQQERAPQDVATLAARLANTLSTMREAFFTLDTALRFTYLNPEAARMLHREADDLIGKLVWDEFKDAIGGVSYGAYGRALREQCVVSFEEFYPPLDCWFEVRCYPSADGLAVYFHDITERKVSRTVLKQAHRALQMLSRCNHVLIHAEREQDLIAQICHIAVEIGGYRVAWVGYAEAGCVTIAAHAGLQEEEVRHLRSLKLCWSAEFAAGRSPVGRAICSGEPSVVDDVEQDPSFAPWQGAAATLGFRGAIYLPLRDATRTFGVLALYAEASLTVDPAEIRLLQELSDNLGFGIGNIRARLEQAKIQAAMMKVAASVSTVTGEHFFEQLAAAMAEAVGADGGFIARLLPGEPLMARTVVAVLDGARIADFSYLVADSPCTGALEQQHYVVPAALDVLFPRAPGAALGAKAYGGWRLTTSSGELIGIVFVMFRKPVPRSDFITSTLQIFAARAAAELERQEVDASLRTQASLLDLAQDAIVVRTMDDHIVFWNKSAERLYGWTREEALGQKVGDLLHEDPDSFAAAKKATLESGHWSGEASRRCKGGKLLTVDARLSLIRNAAGEVHAIMSINTDISQRKAAEREIERLAFSDPLTGLPNRLLLLDRLQHALAITGRGASMGALLFIDLDHFKTINDTLGHDTGDDLLRQIAQRLRTCLYEADTLARFGGDEFVVLVENLSEPRSEAVAHARHICEKILRTVSEPIILDGVASHITASIGVTLFDQQRCDASELLKQADLAMYEMKASGRNGTRFFDPAMQTVVHARAAMEADLRRALENDEFFLHYQPQVDSGGGVTGVEALVRWQSPSRGLVSPASFIPIAEETGLILPLGRWVLERACAQLAHWAQQADLAGLSISVNVSAHQLRQPGFVTEVLDVLEHAGAAPQRLKLEITESLLVEGSKATIATMQALKAKGVGFSLDDFGTGYSSLSYLKWLPLDQLKIDQSFVRDVLIDSNNAAIAQTILALGHSLGLLVIAEGVESAEQHTFLLEHGCTAFQGYLFSRPLPVVALEEFVRRRARMSESDPPPFG